jgi:hypothetical protein
MRPQDLPGGVGNFDDGGVSAALAAARDDPEGTIQAIQADPKAAARQLFTLTPTQRAALNSASPQDLQPLVDTAIQAIRGGQGLRVVAAPGLKIKCHVEINTA